MTQLSEEESKKIDESRKLCGQLIQITAQAEINEDGEIELLVYACSDRAEHYSADIIKAKGKKVFSSITATGMVDAFQDKPVSVKARMSRLATKLQNDGPMEIITNEAKEPVKDRFAPRSKPRNQR